MIPTNTHTYLELPSTHHYPRTSQKSENIWVDLCQVWLAISLVIDGHEVGHKAGKVVDGGSIAYQGRLV